MDVVNVGCRFHFQAPTNCTVCYYPNGYQTIVQDVSEFGTLEVRNIKKPLRDAHGGRNDRYNQRRSGVAY